jgi:hypothetical protein
VPEGGIGALHFHALVVMLWLTLTLVLVESETKEIWALLLTCFMFMNAIAPLLVEPGARRASINPAPVVLHWHALASLEVGADHLLRWAVQVAASFFQNALTSVMVEG